MIVRQGIRGAQGAVLLGLMISISAAAIRSAWAEDHPRSGWTVKILQWDKTGTVAGEAVDFSCPKSGCQEVITLDVEGKRQKFLATISFVQRGAYVGLQPLASEVGKVVQFEKGFIGPVFIAVRDGRRSIETLRFILTGAAAKDAGVDRPALMQNDRSLVFHRKADPDLTLRVELLAPGE